MAVPLAETPDESEHFRYMQYIAQTGQLPVMQPVREDNVTLEAHQPPLLYLVGAGLTGWMGLATTDYALQENHCFSYEADDLGRKHVFWHEMAEWPPQRGVFWAFRVMRWLSLFLGVGTVWLTYRLGLLIRPSDKRVALAAAAILAFNPQFIFMTASLNNDVPTLFLGAAIVTVAVTAVQKKHPAYYIGLGVLVGLGILSKFALLAFWPLAVLAAVWPLVLIISGKIVSGVRYQVSGKPVSEGNASVETSLNLRHLFLNQGNLWFNLAVVIFLPILIAGWWYWRAYQLHGDPFMWEVTLAAKGSVIARTSPLMVSDLWEFVVLHFQSYWLWFGWLNVKPPDWVYGVLLVWVGTAVVGLLRLAWQRFPQLQQPALLFSSLAIAAIYASLFRYIQTINWTGYQGRLAFAAAAPIAVWLTIGLVQVGGTRLTGLSGGGLFLLATAALPWLILPAYPRPAIYQPVGVTTGEVTPVCARFATGWQLEGVSVTTQTKPGEQFTATLHGYGLQTVTTPQPLSLRLQGREGHVIGEGQTTIQWQAGEVFSYTVPLSVTAEALPARAVLAVGLLTETETWQAATSATGRVLDVPVDVAVIKVGPKRPLLPTPTYATQINFGDQLTLIGYDFIQTDEAITATLYWQALTAMTVDYTTFLHVLDEEGNLLTQNDGQPQAGYYPTSIWEAGEIVADEKRLTVPMADTAYQFAVGVYQLDTLVRLPAQDVNAVLLPGQQFLLE